MKIGYDLTELWPCVCGLAFLAHPAVCIAVGDVSRNADARSSTVAIVATARRISTDSSDLLDSHKPPLHRDLGRDLGRDLEHDFEVGRRQSSTTRRRLHAYAIFPVSLLVLREINSVQGGPKNGATDS